MKKVVFAIFISLFLFACENKDEQKQQIKDRISELLKKENQTADDKKQLGAEFKALAELTEMDSSKVILLVQSAKHYQSSGDDAEAMKLFNDIIARFPNVPQTGDAVFGKAFNFELQHQNDSAVKYYKMLIINYPDHILAQDAAQNVQNLEVKTVALP